MIYRLPHKPFVVHRALPRLSTSHAAKRMRWEVNMGSCQAADNVPIRSGTCHNALQGTWLKYDMRRLSHRRDPRRMKLSLNADLPKRVVPGCTYSSRRRSRADDDATICRYTTIIDLFNWNAVIRQSIPTARLMPWPSHELGGHESFLS